MADVLATSFGVLNYSGMLFNKGNTRCPLSTMIGGRQLITNHVEFVTGQEYTGGGDGVQPNISESASLTAPDATVVTRSQVTNVTQIFHESVGVSYGKQSNMGTLSGANVANQSANPISELDFQVAAKMQKIARDIEYTYINGVYNKATSDSEVNKTRGLIPAITSNVLDVGGKGMGLWLVNEAMAVLHDGNAPVDNMTLWVDATTMQQINADATENGLTIVPSDRAVNGIAVRELLTSFGTVYLRLGECLPAGTALLLNIPVIRPVMQPVPGKGNFFLEQLAKTGAGEKYQIFGQTGLDHGPEWYHAKFTNLATTFTPPKGKRVYISGGAVSTVETTSVLTEAKLNKSEVAADNAAQVSCNQLVYDPGVPASSATIAYLWQKKAANATSWTDLTSTYTGYNTATLTVKAADAGASYRCKVTATGTATGTVYSGECVVASA